MERNMTKRKTTKRYSEKPAKRIDTGNSVSTSTKKNKPRKKT